MWLGDSNQSSRGRTFPLSSRNSIAIAQDRLHLVEAHLTLVVQLVQVAKTRLQLDGELQSRAAAHGSAPYKKVYNNAFDALKKTWQSEGVKGE